MTATALPGELEHARELLDKFLADRSKENRTRARRR